MDLQRVPRVPLAFLPTPVAELRNLSAFLKGPQILIKRDDQTGLASGGNKARKLEFLIADAMQQKADVVLTAGAAQSNHCRQTAAAAALCNIPCELILGGTEPEDPGGNLFLDYLFGARVQWTSRERRLDRMNEVADHLRRQGRRPYVIPYGGSNAVGATGFAEAMRELVEQQKSMDRTIDRILIASSSGGTQAGLVVGARSFGYRGSIQGVSIDKGERAEMRYETELRMLANEIAQRIGMPPEFTEEDFVVHYGYLGDGYGVVGELEREAIRLLARLEGILLDPVYTGRAMGALIDMIRSNQIPPDETILFWHTGGLPALFSYTRDLNYGR